MVEARRSGFSGAERESAASRAVPGAVYNQVTNEMFGFGGGTILALIRYQSTLRAILAKPPTDYHQLS
jgi:hypothetical protein